MISNKIRIFGITLNLILIISIVSVPNMAPNTSAQVIAGTVTILGVCGAIPLPTAVSYGSVPPNAISTEQTVTLQNIAGNVPASVSVRGTDWLSASLDIMDVEQTAYSTTSGSYDSKSKLSATDASLGTVPATGSLNTFWQLNAILNDPTFSGPAGQEVTLTVTCQSS